MQMFVVGADPELCNPEHAAGPSLSAADQLTVLTGAAHRTQHPATRPLSAPVNSWLLCGAQRAVSVAVGRWAPSSMLWSAAATNKKYCLSASARRLRRRGSRKPSLPSAPRSSRLGEALGAISPLAGRRLAAATADLRKASELFAHSCRVNDIAYSHNEPRAAHTAHFAHKIQGWVVCSVSKSRGTERYRGLTLSHMMPFTGD